MPNPTPEALVAKWRGLANDAMRRSGTWSGSDMADRIEHMANELEAALAASKAEPCRCVDCHEPGAEVCAVCAGLRCESAVAASKAETAGGEAVDLIPWLYVIRSEFLPDDANLGRESDRKMREALDWATNAMRERATLSAPAAPAAASEAGWDAQAYAGLIEGLEEWKQRAIDAEAALDRMCDALNAESGPTHMGEPVLPAAGAVPEGLIDALRRQRQVDEDGTECGVSRQAVDEAIAILSSLAAAQQEVRP